MGLRPATSSNNQTPNASTTMAPALNEPLVVKQSQLPPITVTTPASSKIDINKLVKNRDSFQLAFEKHITSSDGLKTPPGTNSHMDQGQEKASTTTTTKSNNNSLHHHNNDNSSSKKIEDSEEIVIFSTSTGPFISTPTTSPSPSASSRTILTSPSPLTSNQLQYQHPNNNNTTVLTMGLQKEPEKEKTEMEQMLGELASSGEIDLLQVFKSLESAPSGEGLCDLAGSLSLFNDVDVMNMCSVVDDVPTPNKDADTIEVRADIQKRQAQMQRKCDFLIRRLRKIQSRHMGQHISEEVGNMYGDAYRLFKRRERDQYKISSDDTPSTTGMSLSVSDKCKPISSSAMKTFMKKINHVSTTQSTTLSKQHQIKKLHSTGGDGSSSSIGLHNSSVSTSPKVVNLVPEMDDKMAEKLEQVAGSLQTELRMVEITIDSDATASSSGGESADEMVSYNNPSQETLSISKRAAWRWARDRAAIASRWSWLLAQISDLEYRIRQHNELHLQIRKNKGEVTFEDGDTASTSIQQQLQPPPQQSVNGYRGVLPGNSKSCDSDSSTCDATNSMSAARTRAFQRSGFRKRKLLQTVNLHTISKKAARPSTLKCGCQWPLHPCALCTGRQDPTAPRDLPDTMPASEKVALLDSCFHPVLSFPEDVSHSIQFEAIMRLPEWQTKVMRSSTKSLKGAMAAQKAAEREDRSKSKFNDGRRKYSKKFGLVTNKLKKTKSRRVLQGKYLRRITSTKQRTTSTSGRGGGNKRLDAKSTTAIEKLKKKQRKVSGSHAPSSGSDTAGIHLFHDGASSGSYSRSKNSSPIPGNYSGNYISSKNEKMDIRKSRTSYEIDNIVIPYSMAASTRVELLPYKEIPTPKWRIIDGEELDEEIRKEEEEREKVEINDSSQTVEKHEEDISDDTVFNKHEKALQDERKKFQTFLKFPWSTRSRANRRMDSRAESSGANTPDPTSPAPNTPNIDQESIPSPANPPTPSDGSEFGGDNSFISQLQTSIHPISGNNGRRPTERRRTVSLRAMGGNKDREVMRDELRRSNTPDIKEAAVSPYEPLEFPLPDNIYEEMLRDMPLEHKFIMENCLKSPQLNTDHDYQLETSDMANLTGLEHNIIIASATIAEEEEMDESAPLNGSEDSESLDSIIAIEEDPNDPEWHSRPNTRS